MNYLLAALFGYMAATSEPLSKLAQRQLGFAILGGLAGSLVVLAVVMFEAKRFEKTARGKIPTGNKGTR